MFAPKNIVQYVYANRSKIHPSSATVSSTTISASSPSNIVVNCVINFLLLRLRCNWCNCCAGIRIQCNGGGGGGGWHHVSRQAFWLNVSIFNGINSDEAACCLEHSPAEPVIPATCQLTIGFSDPVRY